MSTNRLGLKTPEDELNLLYGIINGLNDAVVVFDLELKVIFLNKTAKVLYGVDPGQRSLDHNGQLDGLFSPDRITPCSLSELPFFKTEPNDAKSEIKLYMQRPDGTGSEISAAGRPLLGQDGGALGWLVTLTNITPQKQQEYELRQRAEHLEDAQMISNIGNWSWETINDKVYWSDELYRIFGLDPQSPAPSYSEHPNFFTPESFARLNDAVQKALNVGLSYELDLDALHVDGTIRSLIVRGQVKRDQAGQIVGLKGVSIDISNRKRTDKQLKFIIDMIPMQIFVKDTDSRFIIVNKACEEAWGCSSSDLLNTDGSQFFPAEQMQMFLAKDREVWETGDLVSNEELVWSESLKESRLCITLKKTVFDSLGSPCFMIGVIDDITARRSAEESLNKTLASLKAVFDNLPFLAWMKDPEGRYLLVNKHWSEAVGITDPNNLNGITDYDIWPKELAKHYQIADQQVMESRQQVLLTEKALHEGLETWTETIKAPIVDDNDQIIGTTGIARDITERLSAEQQVYKSSERLRLASKAAAIGICEWDVGLRLAEWDERNYEVFGIPFGTPIDYQKWAKLVLPEDLPNVNIQIRELYNTKQEIHWEFRIRRQCDGELRFIRASAIPVSKPSGAVHKFIGVNLDITEFKQIESALREKKQHLAHAQAMAHLGSWSLNCVNNELKWSDENYRIFGVAIGMPLSYEVFLAHVHPEDREYVDRKWTTAMQGEPYDIVHRILVDGKVKWIREHAVLQFASDGSLLHAVGTSQDITELKLVENDLESSRLQLRQLAASRERTREEERKRIALDIHDDLGQMLTSLRMEIALLRMSFAGDNLQFLANIQSITGLLDNTIQVARKVVTKLRPTAIEMGIGPALEWLVKTTALHAGIEFDVIYSESDLDLDEESAIVVFRIVQESINNALKHAQATKMTISMKVESGNYLLEISDNGIGFDSALPKEVNSLGLLGMQERAIMLGGEANISSTLGSGTLIQVRIPVSNEGQRR